MKLTKQLRSEILDVYEAFWGSLFSVDIEIYSKVLDDKYRLIGTTDEEVFFNKKEAISFLKSTADQLAGNIERRKSKIKIEFVDSLSLITEQFDAYVLIENDWTFYGKTRVSTLMQKKSRHWKIIQQHFSFPDAKADEGNTIGLEKIAKENLELREAIKRRTIELETKTHELEIEASLERVRTVTMGMNKAADILDICKVFFKELQALGFKDLRNTLINFWDDANGQLHDYDYSDFSGGHFAKLAYSSHPTFEEFQKKIRKAKDAFAKLVITKDGLKSWQQRRRSSGEYKDPRLSKISALYYYFYSTGVGALGISTFAPISKSEVEVLKRFRNVFDMAYRRYRDIQKSEAQSREAQIELALERVRARTMAMQRSEELSETVAVLFEQFSELGEAPERMAIEIVNEKENVFEIWATQHGGLQLNLLLKASIDEPHVMQKMYRAWKQQKKSITIDLQGNELEEYFRFLKKGGLPVQRKVFGKRRIQNVAIFSKGILTIITPEPRPQETIELLERFANVFDGTYTRFLDLQKAEAQAREVQIELGLERVRARAMAMQKSGELAELVDTVFKELTKLHFTLDRCLILIIDEKSKSADSWMANPELRTPTSYLLELKNIPYLVAVFKAWAERKHKWVYDLKGKEKIATVKYMFSKTELSLLPEKVKQGMKSTNRIFLNSSFANFGGLQADTIEPLSEGNLDILYRFAKVFDLTYTRFLDLQKAEAQAREAKIEAALERTRTQSMFMQHSSELDDTLRVFHEQVLLLGIPSAFSFLWLPDEKNDRHIFWAAWKENENSSARFKSKAINYPLDRNEPATAQCLIDWKSGDPVYSYPVSSEGVENYFAAWQELIDGVEQLKPQYFSDGLYYVEAFMKYGCFGVIVATDLTEDEKKILGRFAIEFDRTYTRFLDLQKAEAQAKEAQIETALERVRSRTMGMQKSEELKEVIQIVYDQFVHLNIHTEHAGFVMDYKVRDDRLIWVASKHGVPSRLTIPYFDSEYYNRFNEAKEKGWDFFATRLSFDEKNDFYRKLFNYIPGLPEDAKDFYFNCPGLAISTVLLENVGLYIENFEGIPYSDEDNGILMRFGKVFQQTYTRFLDLQKAEAQTREAQIEAALEKVRSRSLAMHGSDELQQVVNVVFGKLMDLGIMLDSASIIVLSDIKEMMEYWVAVPGQEYSSHFRIPYFDDTAVSRDFIEARINGTNFYKCYTGKDKNEQWSYLFEHSDLKHIPDDRKKFLMDTAAYTVSVTFTKNTALQLLRYQEDLFSERDNEVFQRFANVFEQAYTRFLDLQKAETQAKEAKIEASLERIRAKAMAMHRSEELDEVLTVLFEQFDALEIHPVSTHMTLIDLETNTFTFRETGKGGRRSFGEQVVAIESMEIWQQQAEKWKTSEPFSINRLHFPKEALPMVWQIFHESFAAMPEDAKITPDDYPDGIYHTAGNCKFGYIGMNQTRKATEEEEQIVLKFATEFGRFYQRFLDLKKAEAQAREATIETALERVRSKTMAMHNSADVGETAAVMVDELKKLGIETIRCGIGIMHEPGDMEVWTIRSNENDKSDIIIGWLDMNMHPLLHGAFESWRKKNDSYSYELQGEDLINYYTAINNYPGYPIRYDTTTLPEMIHHNEFYFPEGILFAFSLEDLSAGQRKIFKRFAGVFGQTYRRYLDLQIAEANAREATIETALEKVRGKAMAMHNSNDLSATASMVFTELRKLGVSPIRCGVGILNRDSRRAQLYSATSSQDGDSLALIGWVQLSNHPVLTEIYDSWIKNEEYFPELEGEQMRSYYELLLQGLPVNVPDTSNSSKQYGHFIPFSIGCLYAWSENAYNETETKILRRFASIIDLTFRRYIELQKTEASAKDAIRQASLGRIRAEIASMRTINDLQRITPLIWDELIILGIPFIRCGVFIMDETQQLIHTFLSTPDGKAIGAFHLPYTTLGNIQLVLNNWRQKKSYIDHWNENSFIEFADILMKQGALSSADQYLTSIPHGGFHLHFLPFLQGMLYVGNTVKLGEDEIKLIQTVADAFSTAYARYEDFNKLEAAKEQIENTLTNLKQAQTQLIQAEKMASLGELTAGIAHEIQNPLNFVNNFSEVSNELLDEMMEEVKKGNYEEVKAILDDVKQNLEKINHHGKRADGIVKGMLQHSRSSSGQMEPTDLNLLADEYLRLAYHGLRAKDKSFNATLKTDYDDSLEKVNVIPQDIGRVVLNLITNAFYVVGEKKKSGIKKYEPTVSVSTKKMGGKIELRVTDNGNGIPQNIIDKIFQPFFTTKPTGQGTGLGLSLAYDIVKAHGGELKVETKEGQGATFIIQLPSGNA